MTPECCGSLPNAKADYARDLFHHGIATYFYDRIEQKLPQKRTRRHEDYSSNSEKLLQKLQAIPVRLSTCTHALWVCVTRIYNELEVQDVSGTLSLKHAQNLCNARSRCGALLRLSWIPGFFGALNSCKPTVGGCLCYQAFHRKSGCCMPSASWHATEAADSWTSTHCS